RAPKQPAEKLLDLVTQSKLPISTFRGGGRGRIDPEAWAWLGRLEPTQRLSVMWCDHKIFMGLVGLLLSEEEKQKKSGVFTFVASNAPPSGTSSRPYLRFHGAPPLFR